MNDLDDSAVASRTVVLPDTANPSLGQLSRSLTTGLPSRPPGQRAGELFAVPIVFLRRQRGASSPI